MRILFAGHSPFLPEVRRGAERNTDQLCRALLSLGHQPAVASGLMSLGLVGKWASVRLKTGDKYRPVRDDFAGYPVFRCWEVDRSFDAILDKFRPDVVVVQSWIKTVARCLELRIPTAYYVHAANEPVDPESDAIRKATLWMTVSRFSAVHNGSKHGLSFHVVPPIVAPKMYLVSRHVRKDATFVGLQNSKGGERVLQLARACPDIPFTIFDNITRDVAGVPGMNGAELRAAALELPNVKLRRPTDTADEIYGTTKILLAPSRSREAWGRVASEAQVNGIPVLASDRGGLPEAVGPGGICLDYDAPLAQWVSHLRAMWDDDTHYTELSARALAHSMRPEFQPDVILGRFAALIDAHVRKRPLSTETL